MKRNVKVILIISGSGHNFMVVALGLCHRQRDMEHRSYFAAIGLL